MRSKPTIKVPNEDVLRAGMKHAEEHLEMWSQGTFVSRAEVRPDGQPPCGTTACLAGHILLAEGHTWRQIMKMDIEVRALEALGFEVGGSDAFAFNEGVFYFIDNAHGRTLGLNLEDFEYFKHFVSELTGVEL